MAYCKVHCLHSITFTIYYGYLQQDVILVSSLLLFSSSCAFFHAYHRHCSLFWVYWHCRARFVVDWQHILRCHAVYVYQQYYSMFYQHSNNHQFELSRLICKLCGDVNQRCLVVIVLHHCNCYTNRAKDLSVLVNLT